MRRAAVAAVLLVLASSLLAGNVTFCGVQFEMPRHWTATRTSDHSRLSACSVGLKPPHWQKTRARSEVFLPEFPIVILVSGRTTREVAEVAGFERVADFREKNSAEERERQFAELSDDDWLIWGKAAAKADPIKGKNWSGAFGGAAVWTGFTDGRGGHTSGAEYRALLVERGGRHRTAYANCDVHPPAASCSPDYGADLDFAVVLRSIKFVGKQ
jgi:hypothetical protein